MLKNKLLILALGLSFFNLTYAKELSQHNSNGPGKTFIFNITKNGTMKVEYKTCDFANNCDPNLSEINISSSQEHKYAVIPSIDRFISIRKVTEVDNDGNIIAQGKFSFFGDGSCAGYDINPIILSDLSGYILCNHSASLGTNDI